MIGSFITALKLLLEKLVNCDCSSVESVLDIMA